MIRWMGLIGSATVLAAAALIGCHKEKKVVIVPQVQVGLAEAPVPAEPAPAPPPAPAYEAPADQTPAPVYESPAPAPAVEAPAPPPAPVVVTPAPVVVAPPAVPVVVAPAPVVVEPVVVQPATAVSISFFHEPLRHHGRWLTVATYGQVWVPAGVPAGWRPYTLGHWVYTDAYGWTWVSDEPFGWATYHYGRWAWVDGYGWAWLPGTVWGPAWVVWRTGGGYVGWAPMPPEAVVAPVATTAEVSININIGVVNHIHPHHWVFVEEKHVMEPVHKHMVLSERSDWIINATRPSTHIVASRGRLINRSLAVGDVERAVGKRVPAMRVRDVDAATETRTVVKGNEVVIPRANLRTISETRAGVVSTAGTGAATGGPTAATPPVSTAGKPIMRKPAVVTTPKLAGTSGVSGPTDAKTSVSTPATIKSTPVTTKSTRTNVERKVQRDPGALPAARSVARSVDTTQVTSNSNTSSSAVANSDLSAKTAVKKAVVNPPPAAEIKAKTSGVATPPTVKQQAETAHRTADASAAVRLGPPLPTTAVGTVRRVDVSRQGPTVSENRDLKVDRAIVRQAKTEVKAPTATAQSGGQAQFGAGQSTSIKRTVSSNQSGPASAGSVKVRTDVRRDRTKSAGQKNTDQNEEGPE